MFPRLLVLLGILLFTLTPNLFVLASSSEQELQTLRERLAAMETEQSRALEAMREEISQLQLEHSSFLDELAQHIIIGGYGAMEFETFQGARTTFEGKLELVVSGQIHDRIRIYNEIDLGIPNGTSKAEQSYVDFLFSKWINLRGGVLQVPFGKFNIDHFDPRRDLTDRPLVARQIIPTTWSDLGISIFGLIPITSNLKSTYEIATINGFTDSFAPGNGGLRSARSSLGKDNNGDKAFVGRAALILFNQYEFGISGYRGASSPDNKKVITGVGGDLEFKPRGIPIWENFEFKGEFAFFDIANSTAPSSLYGIYGQINYHFWFSALNQTLFGRSFANPTLTLVGRVGHAKINTTAGIGNIEEIRYTLGLNYRPIENYVLKTEFQINNGGIERKDWEGFIASISWLF